MKMTTTYRWAILASAFVLSVPAVAGVITNPDDPRTWQGAGVGTFANLIYGADNAVNRQKVVDEELLDDSIFNPTGFTAAKRVRGGSNSGRSLDTTGTGSYDYVLEGGNLSDYSDFIDDKWFQSNGRPGETVFDLGGPSSYVAVFPTIDHGPLPQEAIESTVYLSNTPDIASSWVQAKYVRVYLEGFHNNLGIKWDGFTYVVTTPDKSYFRYASIIHGGPGALFDDGDDEINGLLGLQAVPEPASLLLLGFGAACVARRKKK